MGEIEKDPSSEKNIEPSATQKSKDPYFLKEGMRWNQNKSINDVAETAKTILNKEKTG